MGYFIFVLFLPLYRPRAGIVQRTTSPYYIMLLGSERDDGDDDDVQMDL